MKKLLLFVIVCGISKIETVSHAACLVSDHTVPDSSVHDGIVLVQEAFSKGVLTKELVEEHICKASIHTTSELVSFARTIKYTTSGLAHQVLKKGTKALFHEIENALAALGIVQWAGVEDAEVRATQIRLMALLKSKRERIKNSYEPSV